MYNELTPADIYACSGGNGRNGGAFGDDWLALFILAALMGWGGGGMWGGMGGMGCMQMWWPWMFGGNGIGASQAATAADVQRGFDNNAVINKLNGLENGLCDGFYTESLSMAQGFAGVQNTMAQGFAGINTGMIQQGYENRMAANAVGQKVGDCCCDIRQEIARNNYDAAARHAATLSKIDSCCCDVERQVERGFCDTAYRDATNTTAIVQNAHNDADRIIARLDAMEQNALREKLENANAKNIALQAALDRQDLRRDIVNDIAPGAKPAYLVCNPYTGRYGYDNGGGCGCNRRWAA